MEEEKDTDDFSHKMTRTHQAAAAAILGSISAMLFHN